MSFTGVILLRSEKHSQFVSPTQSSSKLRLELDPSGSLKILIKKGKENVITWWVFLYACVCGTTQVSIDGGIVRYIVLY